MKRPVILACLAIILVQHKADDNHIGNQSQKNAKTQQSNASGAAPSQSTTKPADPKPSRVAEENHTQPVTVTITSVPEVATKPEEDWIMVVLTSLLTVVGMGGTYIAVRTLIHIKRQADTLEDHKTKFEELAKAANSNAEASILQVRAIQEQITEMSVQSTLMASTVTHTEELAKQAVAQTILTQKQLELSQRPWVSVTRIPQSLQFNDTGAILTTIFKFENLGGSVTWNVAVWAELVPNEQDWRPVLEKLRNVPKNPANQNSDYGFVLFPKETTSQRQPAILQRSALDESVKNGSFKDLGKVGLYFVGCVDYRSFVSDEHYQTTFVDLVGYPDVSKGGIVMGAFDPKQNLHIPITLTPHGHGAHAV